VAGIALSLLALYVMIPSCPRGTQSFAGRSEARKALAEGTYVRLDKFFDASAGDVGDLWLAADTLLRSEKPDAIAYIASRAPRLTKTQREKLREIANKQKHPPAELLNTLAD
jgi:hypothetical protein